jgi:sodium/proline symporter
VDPILIGLLLYLALMLAVGLYTFRYMKSLDDFVLAGRRLGPWVAAISERASGESAWFLLGLPAAAYTVGFVEFWSVIGIATGILTSWTFIALRLRSQTARFGALTLPDYFEARFDDRSRLLRVVSMLAILFFYLAYVAAQLDGAGQILNASFGVPHWSGMWIGAAVVALYTLMGGFLAVAWTDLIQGLLMASVAVVLPLAGIAHLGGFHELWSAVGAVDPALLTMDLGKTGAAFLFGVAFAGFSWCFGYLGQPHLLVRYMAIRSTADVPKGQAIAMGWVLIAYWGAPMIGVVGLAVLGPALEQPDQVMPLLTIALLPGWLAGIMIAGATAAMMSTADSQLLVASSAVVEDIYVRLFRPKASPRLLVVLSRIVTVVLTLSALALAFTLRDGIYKSVEYAWTGLGASFGPALVLSLWWKRTTRWGVLAGMLGGLAGTIVWKSSAALQGFLDLKAGPVLVSAALVIAVSLATARREP